LPGISTNRYYLFCCRYGDPGDIVAPVGTWTVVHGGNYRRRAFHVEEFEESPGLFYVNKGTVILYNTSWKTIIYINLKEENIEIDSLRAYMGHVDKLCSSMEIRNLTGCSQFRNSVNDRF
jgi:hypothetical protein